MNPTPITPISSIQQTDGNSLSKAQVSTEVEAAIQSRLSTSRKEKTQSDEKIASDETGSLVNVSIHFRVDDETDDITVFLVDRKSRKVLRSIPASELQKLQIGDLLKLTV
ncbi:MAG: flagellar protein FlaG [Anaerolineales bacterium]